MNEIDKKKVEEFFTGAALKHQNENAVLDVAAGQEHSNVYRNYFTTNYILKNIALKKKQRILDFGCGVGRITKVLAERAAEVVGVDSNQAMIEEAKKFSGKRKNSTYQLLTELKIPIQDNYFDIVFSHWVFQHINDNESVLWLKEIKRVLMTKGKVILFEQVKRESVISANHSFRSLQHYKTLFEKAELKIISTYPVMRVPARGMSFWNKLPALKILLPVLSFIDQVTINRKPKQAEYFTYCFRLCK